MGGGEALQHGSPFFPAAPRTLLPEFRDKEDFQEDRLPGIAHLRAGCPYLFTFPLAHGAVSWRKLSPNLASPL